MMMRSLHAHETPSFAFEASFDVATVGEHQHMSCESTVLYLYRKPVEPQWLDLNQVLFAIHSYQIPVEKHSAVLFFHAACTKLSSTILRPALSKSTVSLLPSTPATVPLPNLM